MIIYPRAFLVTPFVIFNKARNARTLKSYLLQSFYNWGHMQRCGHLPLGLKGELSFLLQSWKTPLRLYRRAISFFCEWHGRQINVWDACINDIREGLALVAIKDSSLSVVC